MGNDVIVFQSRAPPKPPAKKDPPKLPPQKKAPPKLKTAPIQKAAPPAAAGDDGECNFDYILR